MVHSTIAPSETVQDDADQLYRRGFLSLMGWGVQQDFGKAMYEFQLAAQQGHPDAEYEVGRMYLNGWGVDRDYAEATRWFEKAVVQGDAFAIYELGKMYFHGWGVDQDSGKARHYFEMVAAIDSFDADEYLAKIDDEERAAAERIKRP